MLARATAGVFGRMLEGNGKGVQRRVIRAIGPISGEPTCYSADGARRRIDAGQLFRRGAPLNEYDSETFYGRRETRIHRLSGSWGAVSACGIYLMTAGPVPCGDKSRHKAGGMLMLAEGNP